MKYRMTLIGIVLIFLMYFIVGSQRAKELTYKLLYKTNPIILSMEDIHDVIYHTEVDEFANITGTVTGKIIKESKSNIIGEYLFVKNVQVEVVTEKYYLLQINKHKLINVSETQFNKVTVGDTIKTESIDHKINIIILGNIYKK